MKKFLLIAISLLLFLITTGFVDYSISTDKVVTISWSGQGGTYFMIWMHDDDRDIWYELDNNYVGDHSGQANDLSITRPRSGHYSVYVNNCEPGTCTIDGEERTPCCSNWTVSSEGDPGGASEGRTKLMDGTLGGWRIYWKPLMPTRPQWEIDQEMSGH